MKKKITLIISLIVGVAILSIASYYISIYNEENKESTYIQGEEIQKSLKHTDAEYYITFPLDSMNATKGVPTSIKFSAHYVNKDTSNNVKNLKIEYDSKYISNIYTRDTTNNGYSDTLYFTPIATGQTKITLRTDDSFQVWDEITVKISSESSRLQIKEDSVSLKENKSQYVNIISSYGGPFYYETNNNIITVERTDDAKKFKIIGKKAGSTSLSIYYLGENETRISDYVNVTVTPSSSSSQTPSESTPGVEHSAEYYSDTVQFKVGEEAERGFISLDTAFSSYKVTADNSAIVDGEFLMTNDSSYYYMKFTAKEPGTTNVTLNISYSDGAVLKISWPVIVEQGDSETNKAYYTKDYEDLNMSVGQEIHWRRFLL